MKLLESFNFILKFAQKYTEWTSQIFTTQTVILRRQSTALNRFTEASVMLEVCVKMVAKWRRVCGEEKGSFVGEVEK
jgi:hypothetical protein